MIVTAENFWEAYDDCGACDQQDELAVGCETWGIIYDGGSGGQMTVWPDTGRGAIMLGGPSAWGDWDEASRILTTDFGAQYNDLGECVFAMLDADETG